MAKKGETTIQVEGIKEALNFVNIFHKTAINIAVEESADLAKWMANEVKDRIEQQRYKHRPLSPGYVKAKDKAKLDPRILIATGAYLNSIQAIPTTMEKFSDSGKGDEIVAWSVGVPDELHPSSDKLTLSALGHIHEFGSMRAHIPARPHWRPVWSMVVKKKKHEMVKALIAKTRRRARRDAGAPNETLSGMMTPPKGNSAQYNVNKLIEAESKQIAQDLANRIRKNGI